MKTLKKSEVRVLAQVLAGIKLEDLPKECRASFTRNYLVCRTVTRELEDLQTEASDRLFTEEYKTLSQKENRTAEETDIFNKLTESINKEFADIMDPIVSEKVTLKFTPMTDDQFDKLCEDIKKVDIGTVCFIKELTDNDVAPMAISKTEDCSE